jgi:ClpP class serine protease
MLGITSDAVQRGDHATFYSSTARFNDGEREVFRSWLERIYEDFVGKVAEGRDMTFEEVDAIARGRVWSGEDALRLGLIDEIGGLDTAVRSALELSGLDPESPVRLVEVPKPKGLIRSLLDRELILGLLFEKLRLRAKEAIQQGASPGPDQVLEMPFVPQVE